MFDKIAEKIDILYEYRSASIHICSDLSTRTKESRYGWDFFIAYEPTYIVDKNTRVPNKAV